MEKAKREKAQAEAILLNEKGKKIKAQTEIPNREHKSYSPEEDTLREQEMVLLAPHKTQIPKGIVPLAAVALTCGITMWKGRFCFVVRAWGKNLTSWLIQYDFLSNWVELEELIFNTRYPIQNAYPESMGIFRAALDLGCMCGDDEEGRARIDTAYEWLREKGQGVVFGVKGSSRPQLQIAKVKMVEALHRGGATSPIEIRILDTNQLKDLFHYRLTRKDNDYQRFYLNADTEPAYAKMLLAEEKRRDPDSKKIRWTSIKGEDSYFRDCEMFAAACADSSWEPSIRSLAKQEEQSTTAKKGFGPDESQNPQTDLSQAQKIKLLELACSLPLSLNRDGWKANYKEMVRLVTGTASQPDEIRLDPVEELPPGSITYGDYPAQKRTDV